MNNKNKITSAISLLITFAVYKLLQPHTGNPITNIVIAAIIGAVFGGIFTIFQVVFEKIKAGKSEEASQTSVRATGTAAIQNQPNVKNMLIGISILAVAAFALSAIQNSSTKHRLTDHRNLRLVFNHCVLTHNFLSQAYMKNRGYWKKEDPGFKIICQETGRQGCSMFGVIENEVCTEADIHSELNCIKHPDDASYSTDFVAMWRFEAEKPELFPVPATPKNVHAFCRKMDKSCDASFNVYAANNNFDTESVQCSGAYEEN